MAVMRTTQPDRTVGPLKPEEDPRPASWSLWDSDDERSVISALSGTMRDRILACREKEPDLFNLEERDLKKVLQDRGARPTKVDQVVRMKFWMEYDRAFVEASGNGSRPKMSPSRVFGRVCSKEVFYTRYLHTPEKVAWMLCPPVDYEAAVDAVLSVSIGNMFRILEVDAVEYDKETGNPVGVNEKLAKLQVMIHEKLSAGKYGLPMQRRLNVNATLGNPGSGPDPAERSKLERDLERAVASGSTEEIDRHIKLLSARQKEAASRAERQREVIEVESTPQSSAD